MARLRGIGIIVAVLVAAGAAQAQVTPADRAGVFKAAGAWCLIDQNQGIPTFLATRGAGGWPDMEVGGPGFCFPIVRCNGKQYAFLRNKEYERGACARR